jgi:transposase-like protein
MIEGIRWPGGPVCGHCGEGTRRYETKRPGRWRCGNPACRKDYTVTTGTVMEASHIPLHKWLMAFYLESSSKKGFSAHQLHRSLGITYKSAWFLHHRVMEAMRQGGLALPPMGGAGQIVEADETYFGGVESAKMRTAKTSGRKFTKSGKSGPSNKRAIVSLVERGGTVRSFHVPRADKATVGKIVADNIAHESRLHTDQSRLYHAVGNLFGDHETVNHSAKEYVRDDVHVNSAEGYFSIFKRGMRGVYQHCSEKHLHRYLAEFDFRYNHREALGFGDEARTKAAVKGSIGKRLTYHQPDAANV